MHILKHIFLLGSVFFFCKSLSEHFCLSGCSVNTLQSVSSPLYFSPFDCSTHHSIFLWFFCERRDAALRFAPINSAGSRPQDCYCGSEQRATAARLLWEYKCERMWMWSQRSGTYGFAADERRKAGLWDATRPPWKETTAERSGSCLTAQTGGVDKLWLGRSHSKQAPH